MLLKAFFALLAASTAWGLTPIYMKIPRESDEVASRRIVLSMSADIQKELYILWHRYEGVVEKRRGEGWKYRL